MSFFELLENTPKFFGFMGIFLFICTIAAFIFNFSFKFRIIGATIFSLLLSLSSWAFIQSYNEKVVIEDAKYLPIVYDNGFDLIIAKADDDFPEESIEPTLKQLSENLLKGSRSGANVKIKIRKLEKISDNISKPVVIGEVQKNVKMNLSLKNEN
ncbi:MULTISPECIES: DUF2518 family protein [Prochlorococcus]|uniref:DUF2518 family protein n=1 Tax=Prochlorococcus TaxID=1218 RepID=UPI000517525E|nr:DUF2518 family protein [Prochlorococcus marinus]